MRIMKVALLSLFTLAVTSHMAHAQPTAFKKIKRDGTLKLTGCNLFEDVSKIEIVNSGKAVALLSLKNRETYSLNKKYKFFACADNGLGNVNLFAKSKPSDTPVEFDLSLTDFPKAENNIGSACSSVKSWPGSHIYKTIGSHHFTDIRRNTIGLILKVGASGPYPSCVSAVDSSGKEVAKLGLYARGAGWAARYYAGFGCGSRTALNGSAVASKAKKNSGKTTIYMDFGNVCYGPIDANRCVGSKAC